MSEQLRASIDRLASLVDPGEPDSDDLAARLADLVGATRLQPAGSFLLPRLVSAFGLSPFEADIATLVGLPEEHELLSHLARRLHPRGEPWLTFGTLAVCLQLDGLGRHRLREALDEGPLVRNGLIGSDTSLPMPERTQQLATGLWSSLRGVDHWPQGLRPLETTGGDRTALGTAAGDRPLLDAPRLRAGLVPGARVVLVTGAGWDPYDVAASVAALVRALGHHATLFNGTQLDGSAAAVASAHLIARQSIPVVVGAAEDPPLATHPAPVVLCATDTTGLRLDDRPVLTFELGERSFRNDIAMWTDLVPELNGGAETLAGYLRIDHRRAFNAVADARVTARNTGNPLDVGSIVRHVRRRTDSTLPPTIRLRTPRVSWDSLVTTDANDDLLRSVVARFENQVRVLDEWGFSLARNTAGVRAMFSGPPGTGKTLSAEVIAGALGLDLLVVDLSALVSKWLGETEKNISEVFDAAERSQAVLFFDEADSVFAKRTDAGDAQGRWANLETAHLLTRMEASKGLVILATNLRTNIDEAFVRRLDVIVEFKEPGVAERRRLWQAHLPAAAPLADDLELDQLAALYEVTGGLIRNAALDAAFRAAASNTSIDQRSLILSVEREYQKAGRSFPGIPRSLAGVQPGGASHGN